MDEIDLFTKQEADRIYTELGQLYVELDTDPLAYGPKRLNSLTADARAMLHRCERLFLEVSQKLHNNKREFRIKSTVLDLAKKDLFANDPETRAGRSVGDRDAIATGKLKAESHLVHLLDVSVQDMEAILAVIKAKRADLRDTQNRLKDQIRLCQEEIGLGDRWGSRVPNAGDLKTHLSVVSTSDLNDLIGTVDGEIHLQEATEPVKPERITAPDPIFINPTISISDAMTFKGNALVEKESGENKPPVDYHSIATAVDGEVVRNTPAPTATTQEVDAFFADASAAEEIKIPKQNLIDDATIQSILASFEQNE